MVTPNANTLIRVINRRRARLGVGLVLLSLALVQLLLMAWHIPGYWAFASWMTAADALLCIWLTGYLRASKQSLIKTIWPQVLHWIGVIATMYFIALLIDRGVIEHADACVLSLMVLALSLYLAGIYIDTAFLLVGLTIGLMATLAILVDNYLLMVMIPIMLVVAIIMLMLVYRDRTSAE